MTTPDPHPSCSLGGPWPSICCASLRAFPAGPDSAHPPAAAAATATLLLSLSLNMHLGYALEEPKLSPSPPDQCPQDLEQERDQ
jgi:hypothetical protein